MSDDPIDAAIASTAMDGPSTFPPMVEIPVLIASTGRPAIVALPADVTPAEIAEVCAWMLLQAHAFVVGQRRQSRIIVPRSPIA